MISLVVVMTAALALLPVHLEMQTVLVPDKVAVAAPGGQFTFSELRIKDRTTLVGVITNATPHDWFVARFELTFGDSSGRPLKTRQPIQEDVIGIAAGQSMPAEFYLSGVDGRKVARVDIAFLPDSKKSPRFVARIVKPESRPDLSFETASVHMQFRISRDYFSASLRNKGDKVIQIDWNTASLVGVDGKAHRVIHDGVKLEDRDKPQVPSIIPPGASIDVRITSIDDIEFDPLVRRVLARPFFQVSETTAPALKGKTFGILLPLVIDGKTEQIYVMFIIEDVLL